MDEQPPKAEEQPEEQKVETTYVRSTHAYMFKRDAARTLLKALGLDGQRVKRVVLTFDVGEPVTAVITAYSLHENHAELCRTLTAMGPWLQDITSGVDDMRQYANPTPTQTEPNTTTQKETTL